MIRFIIPLFCALLLFACQNKNPESSSIDKPAADVSVPKDPTPALDSSTLAQNVDDIKTVAQEELPEKEATDQLKVNKPKSSQKLEQKKPSQKQQTPIQQEEDQKEIAKPKTPPIEEENQSSEQEDQTKEEIIRESDPDPMPQEAPKEKAIPFTHDLWDVLLRKHVSSNGKVNYAGFKADQKQLEAYLSLLAANVPSGKSTNQQKAYWINVYNAFTIDLIINNYPISSILKLDNGKTWDVPRIELDGKKYTLNQIEKEILIKGFKDGRIHFAVNCAAKSCPPLLNRAWKAANLNQDLEQASKSFINNTTFNQIKKKEAKLSKIFEWYPNDFGDLKAFINRYANTPISDKTKIQYNEYDWALNN